MGCNCSKKKLTPTGNKIVKNTTSSRKPVVKTSRRTVVRRTAR